MKIFVNDDNVPLDVPLVPDVAGDNIVVEPPPPLAKKQRTNNKPWHDHLCSSSTCEWIAATSL